MTGHHPRKRFGQHFLHDPFVLGQIGAAVNLQPGDRLFEIGPGRGALTAELYSDAIRYRAVEIDRDLVAPQRAKFPQLELIQGDVLQVPLEQLLDQGPWRVVGNLPYNISTPLLGRLFEHMADISDIHVMLQREVAQRLAALPGSKAFGRLSVGCQVRMQVIPLFDVPPESFTPAPAVHSAVVRLLPRPLAEQLDAATLQALDRILRLAFQQRRKRLSNALKSLPVKNLATVVDPAQRADQVGVADYVALAQLLVQTEGQPRG